MNEWSQGLSLAKAVWLDYRAGTLLPNEFSQAQEGGLGWAGLQSKGKLQTQVPALFFLMDVKTLTAFQLENTLSDIPSLN